MPVHNDVETTCTASHLTGWDINNLKSVENPKAELNARLATVNSLIHSGYKRDFDLIFVIVTDTQVVRYGLDEFLPNIGFTEVFVGDKDDGAQRHKETGALHMYTVKPRDYEAGLKAYKEELTELKERIDPPKKPDPKRQKVEDLKLSHLRKAGIVFDNASVDNPISSILAVEHEKAYLFIKMKFGIDIKKWNNYGDNWTRITTRTLKSAHKAWKEELV